ncbi:hypothetical protein ABT160_41850, partial [Streptomyces sp. NPDC001941]
GDRHRERPGAVDLGQRFDAGAGQLVWERLVRRAAAGWPPEGRYPLELYLEDLRARDDLADRLAAAPPELRAPFAGAAEELDALFRAHTADDGGALLGALTRSGAEVARRGWWWHRRPDAPPWT